MNYTQLTEIYEREGFRVRTGERVKQLYECRTYDRHGNFVKVEAPSLSELAKKDLEHLKHDKILRHWVEHI